MAEELIELGRACGRGKIRRRGYVTKRGVRVPATCVVDQGAAGKTPSSKRWFPKGVSVPGWSKDKTTAQRHTALNNLTEKRSCKRVLADMNAIANVTADPETKKKMRSDRNWLKEKGSCKL